MHFLSVLLLIIGSSTLSSSLRIGTTNHEFNRRTGAVIPNAVRAPPHNLTNALSYFQDLDISLSSKFSSSNATAARIYFDLGFKLYEIFWYDLAQTAFQYCRLVDPTYYMSYWAEAMTYKETLFHVENPQTSLSLLQMIPTASLNDFERTLVNISFRYFEANKTTVERETSYKNDMESLYNSLTPSDLEITFLYSLSLMGVAGHSTGEAANRILDQCRTILQPFVSKNISNANTVKDSHLGMLHLWIHLNDDPVHADLAKDQAEIAKSKTLGLSSHVTLKFAERIHTLLIN
jgi:hypothetical protein